MNRLLLLWGLSLAAACGSPGGNSTDAGFDAGAPMPSMLTASGALTGTISAPKPTVGYDATATEGSFFLRKTTAGLPFKADINISFGAAPSPATFNSSSPGFKCDVTVTSGTAAMDTWVARHNSVAGANRGSCSITFTSATMGAGGYDVSGTLAITADNSGGAATGMVMLSGSF